MNSRLLRTALVALSFLSWSLTTAAAQAAQAAQDPGKSTNITPTAVKITVKNLRDDAVDIFWVDFTGAEKSYGSLASNKTWEVQTGHGHLWRFKQGGKVIGFYQTTGQAAQTYDLTQPESDKPLMLEGQWKDGDNYIINIMQTGHTVVARAQPEALRKWWDTGVGMLENNRLSLKHTKGDQVTANESGTASSDAKTIQWDNGTTWKRVIVEKPAKLFDETYTVPKTKADCRFTFFNEGGYVARYFVSYTANGKWNVLKTGNMALKEPQKSFAIPGDARDVVIWGEAFVPNPFDPHPWTLIFEKKYAKDPPTIGFKTYGTVFDPEWNNNTKPWTPIIEGTVHVTNESGQRLYMSYCTDLEWSIANLGSGVILGGLVDSAQKKDPTVVRWFTASLALDIPLPSAAFDYFKDIAFTMEDKTTHVAVETSVLDTIKSLVSLATGPVTSALDIGIDNVKNSDEWRTKNLQFNPIIASANILGAETLNVVIVNEDMSRYWIIPTAVDDSWVIRKDRAYRVKPGTLTEIDSSHESYPSIAVPK